MFLFVVYLIYAIEWTFDSHLGPFSTVGGVVLWMLEVFAAVLSCAYLWELCDALGTEHWRRRITRRTRLSVPDSELPMVGLHVPAHNEPPDMVIETLRSDRFRPVAAGLPGLAAGAVLPAAVLLLQLLLRRVAAVPQRA